jgi:hypothetical protein
MKNKKVKSLTNINKKFTKNKNTQKHKKARELKTNLLDVAN